MKFTALDLMETYVSNTETHHVTLADYKEGVHCTTQAFFKKNADGTVPWVISRVCDHAGGTLRLSDTDPDKAVCPLHNWEFDFDALSYSKIPNQQFAHITKKPLPFSVADGVLTYETEELHLRVPASISHDASAKAEASLRFLAHACVALELDGIRMITDPWLVGECMAGSWWLKHPPKADAWTVLKHADFIYISHNHPDHLHAETLNHASKNTPIIVPKFETDSVAKPLRDMGFTQVIELELKRLYRVNDSEMLISILPTGDHREDSGLFVTKGDFSTILTVDCVGANHYVLPRNITMLLTNFASGASGWPLCYDVVGPLSERAKIVTKNRGNAVLEVMKYVAATSPKAYMPYAGYFDELAPRDAIIRRYNIKNDAQTVTDRVADKFPNTIAVNPITHDTVTWKNGEISVSNVDLPPLFTYQDDWVAQQLDAQKALLKHFDIHKVADYFCLSEFQDALIVYLVLTDDDYTPTGESLRIDFSVQPIRYTVVDGEPLLEEFEALTELHNQHHLLIKARIDSMWKLVLYGRPLEELSLGFQCRIDRKPDQYNAAFWKHYTTYSAPMLRRGEDRLLYKLLEGAE